MTDARAVKQDEHFKRLMGEFRGEFVKLDHSESLRHRKTRMCPLQCLFGMNGYVVEAYHAGLKPHRVIATADALESTSMYSRELREWMCSELVASEAVMD